MHKNKLLKNKGFTQSVKSRDARSASVLRTSRLSTAGFTMLEVLVVVFIITILVSVVMASVNSVRTKSDETTIKSNLAFIRSGAIKYFNRYNHYGTATVASATTSVACSTASTILDTTAAVSVNSYIVEAENASDSSSTWVATCAIGKLSTETNATSYAVAVPLKTQNVVSGTSGTDYWCVDSAGNAGAYDSNSLGGGSTTVAKCS